MPKMKTNLAPETFKVTGSGRLKKSMLLKSHILTKKI
jgi:ribosomal protein L35